MKLLKLEMESFQSFVSLQTIEFKAGLFFVVAENRDGGSKADSNGSGKTAMLNAICWAMYGRTPAGITGKDIISHPMQRACVRLELGPEYGIPELVITREQSRSKGQKVSYVYNGETHKGDVKFLQTKIDGILDVSFETFCSTIYLGKNASSVQFLFAPPAKRSEILSDLVNDLIFRKAAVVLDKRGDRLTEELSGRRLEKSSLTGRQQEMVHTMETLESNLISWEADEQDRIMAVHETLSAIDRRRTSLIKDLPPAPSETMADLGEQRSALFQKREQCRREILELTAVSGTPLESITSGEVCGTCRQPISEKTYAEHVESHSTYIKKRKQMEVDFANLERDLEATDRRLNTLRTWKQQEERTLRELEQLKSEEVLTQDKLHPREPKQIAEQIAEARAKAVDISRQLVEIQASIDILPVHIKVCNDLQLGFKTEVRNLLFDALRDSLEYYVDFYLQILTGGEFKVAFPTRADVAKEKFEILLTTGAYEQDISGYSEGEAWRASFAVLLALRRVLSDKSKNRLEFLLVDDPVGGLDLSGVQEFMRLLEKLTNEEVPFILATIPRDDIISTHRVIRIIKENRVSRIV